MTPQRQAAAAHHEHDDDHKEWQCATRARQRSETEELADVVLVAGDEALPDTDQQSPSQSRRERRESTEESSRQTRNGHDQREGGDREAGERCDQDARQAREGAAHGPGQCGELVR